MFNVNFGQNFQSSHHTDLPYRNLRKRDVCAPGKELPHHLQLKRLKRFETSSERSQGKAIRRTSGELQMSSTAVWRVVRKHLYMIFYKLHFLQHLKDNDKPAREDFCTQMQAMLEEDGFDDRHVFSNEATFHPTVKVNRHNTRIWGTEHSHLTLEHVRDSPKVNVFCAISKILCMGFFLLKEQQSTLKRTLICCKIG